MLITTSLKLFVLTSAGRIINMSRIIFKAIKKTETTEYLHIYS